MNRFERRWTQYRLPGYLKKVHNEQRGEINLSAILMMGIGFVFIAVGAIMFPQITSASSTILDYAYSANASITDATFTGLTAVTGITPVLVLLGYLAVAVLAGFMGVKVAKGDTSTKFSPGNLLLLAVSLVFVAVGLYIFPTALDGFASVAHGDGLGISSSFTGLSPLILISPMLLLIAFISSTVVVGYFGIKGMSD